jgi:hypothetical protein
VCVRSLCEISLSGLAAHQTTMATSNVAGERANGGGSPERARLFRMHTREQWLSSPARGVIYGRMCPIAKQGPFTR